MDRRKFMAAAGAFAAVTAIGGKAWANKSKATLEVPAEAKKGEKVKVKINVEHEGNKKFHHTDWVSLKSGDRELKRWEYGGDSLPPDQNFSVEYELTLDATMELSAEAHCNVHGSTGVSKATLKAV